MPATDRYSVLTRVGKGTSMGKYMRFFWHPIAASIELQDEPKPIKLLGEKLVLFSTKAGEMGLVEERCAHRSASLACGMIEEHGIRCSYHGWKYDLEGRCVETPAERPESKLKDRIRIAGYPVQELGGLIWAYLGEHPEPLLPRFEYIVGEQYDHDVTVSVMPCNWLQIAENNVDPHHVEYLHMMYTNYRFERQGKPPVPLKHHAKVGFDIFEHGIMKRRLWEGDSEDSEEWRIGHPQIWPGTLLVTFPNGVLQAQIRVPQDDTHTVIYWYNCRPRPAGQPPKKEVPVKDNPFFDAEGKFLRDNLNGQDMMVMLTQGEIADRSTENLGESDRGVVLYRRHLLHQIERIERGEEPMGVVRDPAANTPFIKLPLETHLGYSFQGVEAAPGEKWEDMSVATPSLVRAE